jgi:hypothetical protein
MTADFGWFVNDDRLVFGVLVPVDMVASSGFYRDHYHCYYANADGYREFHAMLHQSQVAFCAEDAALLVEEIIGNLEADIEHLQRQRDALKAEALKAQRDDHD